LTKRPNLEDVRRIPLYASEQQIADEVFGPGNINRWQALVSAYEGKGLPAINPLTQCRYWPAVRAWLDSYEGLRGAGVRMAFDGPERPVSRRTRSRERR